MVAVIQLLEADQVLVAGRQRAGGDQDAAQVPERFAVGQFVEGGVGQRSLAAGELTQDRRRGAACSARPARCRVVRGRPGCRAGPAVGGGSCRCRRAAARRSRCRSEQRAHRRERCWVGSPQPGQACQNDAVGLGAGRAERAAMVPPRIGRTLPQPAQRARRCWQAWHHGLPGELGDLGRAPSVAQIEQVIVLHRPAGRTQRPAGRPDADRAAPAAADARLLVGGVGDQAVGTQRPSRARRG